jgi:hypothetical protein
MIQNYGIEIHQVLQASMDVLSTNVVKQKKKHIIIISADCNGRYTADRLV